MLALAPAVVVLVLVRVREAEHFPKAGEFLRGEARAQEQATVMGREPVQAMERGPGSYHCRGRCRWLAYLGSRCRCRVRG